MLERRTLRVIFVKEGQGIGIDPTLQPDKVVEYSGATVNVMR
jgi:hypothetical protein